VEDTEVVDRLEQQVDLVDQVDHLAELGIQVVIHQLRVTLELPMDNGMDKAEEAEQEVKHNILEHNNLVDQVDQEHLLQLQAQQQHQAQLHMRVEVVEHLMLTDQDQHH
jgi:hypothetical protein